MPFVHKHLRTTLSLGSEIPVHPLHKLFILLSFKDAVAFMENIHAFAVCH